MEEKRESDELGSLENANLRDIMLNIIAYLKYNQSLIHSNITVDYKKFQSM